MYTLVYVTFAVSKIISFPFYVIGVVFVKRKVSKLAIEAGEKGWELLEFKNLLQMAREYVGENKVAKISVLRNCSYINQVFKNVKNENFTHYMYDPRTGSQNWLIGMMQAFVLSLIFKIYKIIPIVNLTDFSIRKWRNQAAIITAINGCVLTFLSAKEIKNYFPHKRIFGPSIMPLSTATIELLQNKQFEKNNGIKPIAVFAGSLYEPRKTILNQIKDNLASKGHNLVIFGREIGGLRISDEDYWMRLARNAIVVTTVDQINTLPGMDANHIPSFVYRFLEATVAGSLLVAPEVPGVNKFFEPGRHFVSFESIDEAVSKIKYFLENDDERERIAKAGKERADSLIKSRSYWLAIDAALGTDSIL